MGIRKERRYYVHCSECSCLLEDEDIIYNHFGDEITYKLLLDAYEEFDFDECFCSQECIIEYEEKRPVNNIRKLIKEHEDNLNEKEGL